MGFRNFCCDRSNGYLFKILKFYGCSNVFRCVEQRPYFSHYFFLIILGALYKNIDIFDAFVEGAKGGFEVAIKIIPYLVGMLVAISLLRTSGTFEVIIDGMSKLIWRIRNRYKICCRLAHSFSKTFKWQRCPRNDDRHDDHLWTRIHLPVVYLPFCRELQIPLFISWPFTYGAVSIKNTRYSIGAMLFADLVGIVTSIFLAYLFFGNVH